MKKFRERVTYTCKPVITPLLSELLAFDIDEADIGLDLMECLVDRLGEVLAHKSCQPRIVAVCSVCNEEATVSKYSNANGAWEQRIEPDCDCFRQLEEAV